MKVLEALWMVPLLGFFSVLQASVGGIISVYGVKPDLVLVAVLMWTLYYGSATGIVWAFIGGIWLDIFSGGVMGLSSLALMFAALIGGLGNRTLSRSNFLVPVFTVFVGSLTFSLVYLSMLEILATTGLFMASLNFQSAVESIVVPATLYNMTIMLVVIPLFNRTGEGIESLD